MRRALPLFAMLASAGCQSGLTDGAELASLDEAYFRCKVQPVVTKSCSMFVCHGDARRYYKVFGRNRLRYGLSEDERNATMTDVERRFDFDATRAQVDLEDPESSFLLLKPLDEAAGGYFHGGATEFGQGDVFLSREEQDFQTILAWVKGATEDPTCIEPGSDL
ncbi:MAG: hypothetical protein KDE53_19750 [Caldilineaceae bacterium]|nr:hypothetical protein [Myxococcales bacterium]MCB0108171.1 hypothetical protein [Caldilineaceae bacterium]